MQRQRHAAHLNGGVNGWRRHLWQHRLRNRRSAARRHSAAWRLRLRGRPSALSMAYQRRLATSGRVAYRRGGCIEKAKKTSGEVEEEKRPYCAALLFLRRWRSVPARRCKQWLQSGWLASSVGVRLAESRRNASTRLAAAYRRI